MSKSSRLLFTRLLASTLILLAAMTGRFSESDAVSRGPASKRPAPASKRQLLPLAFIENPASESPRNVTTPSFPRYLLQGRNAAASFSREGVRLSFSRDITGGERKTAIVGLEFIGSRPDVELVGEDQQSTRISYFTGRKSNWRSGLRSFSRVVYPDLWPGIDLVFSGDQTKLKYEFLVHPGADPSLIRMAYRGLGDQLSLDQQGQLEIPTSVGTIHDEKPISFQDLGRRIETSFKLAGQDNEGRQVYGFKLGRYDRKSLLVIDPAIQAYAGFIGGSGEDEGHSVAVDAAGNAYITGITTSLPATFPDQVGPGATFGGRSDAFVARIKADGSGLDYAGYIGGAGDEAGHSIAIDATGHAYIAGWTSSGESTFPVTGGPDLTYGGAIDGFIARINPTGSAILFCGYIGGQDQDEALDIAIDTAGRAYLTGLTASDQTTFPANGGPDLTFNGTIDAFVARVKADGTSLEYAGFIGGAGNDQAQGIAVDSSNNVYLTGLTTSTPATFPIAGPLDATFNGAIDAFIAKINSTGTTITYCGYIGGDAIDEGTDIAIDQLGQATITGRTASTQSTFPVTIGPDLTANGEFDAFVAKVNSGGTALLYAGFIGGAGNDEGNGVALDPAGNAYVVGRTSSSGASFPESNSFDLTLGGSVDGFVAMIVATGEFLNYATYIGGNGDDVGLGIAVKSVGSAYLSGVSRSADGSFPTLGGLGSTLAGGADAFILNLDANRLEADLAPRPAGNRIINLDDWQQAGRFAIGIDSVNNSGEFQPADSAPRPTLGDGRIDLLDWIQTGRYASGLDSLLVAGGAASASMTSNIAPRSPQLRNLIAGRPVFDPSSRIVTIPVLLSGYGGENGLTFSVDFDPSVLQYIKVTPEIDNQPKSQVLVNKGHAATGQIGVGLALHPGTSLNAGSTQLLGIQFKVRFELATRISIGDGIVPLALADTQAFRLAVKGTVITFVPNNTIAIVRKKYPAID